MTGGFDDGYGSASSHAPTEGSEEERTDPADLDGSVDAGADSASDAAPQAEIPRNTRPFRAWGAAHERDTGPSVWDRFVGWLRGLFARKETTSAALRAANKSGPVRTYTVSSEDEPAVDDYGSSARLIAPGADDFAASEDVSEDVSAPAVDDFAPQDDFSSSIPSADVAPVPDADPLWDAPVVAEAAPTAPPSLEVRDFDDVWTPREEAVVEEPAAIVAKKKGFFARLFSRKPKEPDPITDEHRAAAQAWESELAEIQGEDHAALEPADADFADSPTASAVPAVDDFAAEVAPPPSTEHSVEDAANLAAVLGSLPPRETPVVEVTVVEETLIIEEAAPIEDLAPVEEQPADEPPAVVDDAVDESLLLDALPDPEVLPKPASPVREIDPSQKPGFFSGLLRRVSRAQFIPKAAIEPEPAPAPVAEVEAPVVEEQAPPVAAAPAVEPEFQATQPFPAFRDARDDFAEEEKPQETGRPTEEVEVPAFDDGEKTDEFEAIPADDPGTAETRQVAGLWGRMFGTKVEEAVATPDSGEAPATAAADDKTPFVLAKFRTFYNEIIRDKHQKSDVISGFATAVMGSAGATDSSDPEFAAQLLSKRLSEMLELQAAESNWTGGDAAKYYPEAQYAMVALADETFATTDWAGRASWHKYMLEPRMYGTRGAELEFFKRIDKLLKEAPQDKGARDLARLYLLVIASGFRGKFRVPNVRRPLAEYRRRLYEYSHQEDPLALYERERRILPAAVEHTLESRAVGRFTSAQKWIATVLILMVLYIGISQYAWSRLSADLRDIMSRIENTDIAGRTP